MLKRILSLLEEIVKNQKRILAESIEVRLLLLDEKDKELRKLMDNDSSLDQSEKVSLGIEIKEVGALIALLEGEVYDLYDEEYYKTLIYLKNPS